MAQGFNYGPGQNLTRNNRFAQMLMQQEQNAPPITAHSQGLASMLRQGLAAYMQGQDSRQLQAAQEAFATPLDQQPPGMAPGEQGPPQAPVDPYGSRRNLMMELSQGGNDRATQMLPWIAQASEDYGLGQEQLADRRNYASGVAATERTQELEDLTSNRKYDEAEWNRQQLESERLRKLKAGDARSEWKYRQANKAPPASLSPEALAQQVTIAEATAGAKPLSGEQAKSGGFALRMDGAQIAIDSILAGPDGVAGSEDDYDPTNIQDATSANLPRMAANFAMSDPGREFRQAQEDWVTANLRKESGAVIGVEEMEKEIAKYFPEINDTPAVLKQKALSRQRAFAGMKVASGRAFEEMQTEFKGTQPSASGWSIVRE